MQRARPVGPARQAAVPPAEHLLGPRLRPVPRTVRHEVREQQQPYADLLGHVDADDAHGAGSLADPDEDDVVAHAGPDDTATLDIEPGERSHRRGGVARRLNAAGHGAATRGRNQPWASSARPVWMSRSAARRRVVTSPGSPSATVHECSALLTVPTGVMTAAVPQAKTSVISPEALPSRQSSMLIRPSSAP